MHKTDQGGLRYVAIARCLGRQIEETVTIEKHSEWFRSTGQSVSEKKEVKVIVGDGNDVMRRNEGLAKERIVHKIEKRTKQIGGVVQ